MYSMSSISQNLTKKNMHKEQITRFLRINFALPCQVHGFFFKYTIATVIKPPENGLGLEIYPIYLEDSETRINLI